MDQSYYEALKLLYDEIDGYLPQHDGNPCKSCNMCCTSLASQGVSLLELDYIEEFLTRKETPAATLLDFIYYVSKKNVYSSGSLLCPFYDKDWGGCSIYLARPLSCRTFGYFIREENLDLIPSSCFLKKTTKIYTDETFPLLLPFTLPFYTLVNNYEEFLKKKMCEFSHNKG